MSTISRRSLLQLAGLAGAGLGLTACSTAAPGGGGSTGSSSQAAWPTYQPAQGPTPDLASTVPGGGMDAYFRYPDSVVKTVAETPGDGSAVTSMVMTYSPPFASGNQLNAAIVEALGADVQLSLVPVAEYDSKLTTVSASNDLPDTMLMTTMPRAKQFLRATCADITDFVSGDAIADYPNLAAIPTYAWEAMGRVDGRIYGVPLVRGRQPTVMHVNRTALDSVAAPDPWTRDEFGAAMEEVTGGGRYGLGPFSGEDFLLRLFTASFGAPNGWQVTDGVFTMAQASDGYKEALEFVRDMIARGLYHPSSGTLAHNDMMNEYYAGKVAAVGGNFTNFATGVYFDRVGDRFQTDIAPIFAPDYSCSLSSGLFGYTAFKQADPDRIRMLLRICDYLAAPYGSEEWQLVNLGVEGVHFERDADGAIQMTDLAADENANTVPFKYIGDSMDIIQVLNNEEATQRAFDFFETVVPAGVPNPALGLDSQTLDTEAPAMDQKFNDAIAAIVTGRKDIDTWDSVVQDVLNSGGAAAADELAASYEAAQV